MDTGQSSGGTFAAGDYRRRSWSLELHVRQSLGLVSYHHRSLTLSHVSYLWAVSGRRDVGQYPGFSDDTLDSFRRLATDLQKYFSAFLCGDAVEFARIHSEAQRLGNERARLSPLQRLSQ